MLFKTTLGHQWGCVSGADGPCSLNLPEIGNCIVDADKGLRICRPSDLIVVVADCQNLQPQAGWWVRFIRHAHGVLLRRLGKVRVVYLVQTRHQSLGTQMPRLLFHSNVNLVTGVHHAWLDGFSEQRSGEQAIAAAAF